VRVHVVVHKIILALVLVAWLPSIAFALTPAKVYERVQDSVVVVKVGDQQGQLVSSGSGVVLPSGDVITNYHVVEAGVRYTVGRGKHVVAATLKAGDPDKDLCLLAAPGLVAEPARLGRTDRLKVGDPVYAVGAPQGLELSLSEGIISQLRGGGPHPIIQTTVAISPGSSGGGLFNAKGELVGITTFRMKGEQSLNFALPVEWIGEISTRKTQEAPRVKAPGVPEPGTKPKEGWNERGKALEQAHDWKGLLDHSRRWTQAEPGNYLAWSALGVAYGQSAPRSLDAMEAYHEAVRLKPDCAEAWADLGRAYANLGRYRDAVSASQSAVRLKPDYAYAWFNLAIAYENSGNRSAALEALKELRRYDPKEAERLYNSFTSHPRP
jgi:Flp pilus assembly protein TadD